MTEALPLAAYKHKLAIALAIVVHPSFSRVLDEKKQASFRDVGSHLIIDTLQYLWRVSNLPAINSVFLTRSSATPPHFMRQGDEPHTGTLGARVRVSIYSGGVRWSVLLCCICGIQDDNE